jgi:hypothetical protein
MKMKMGSRVSDLEIVRQIETVVPGPNGSNRFITVVAAIPLLLHGAGPHRETYTCLIGPVLKEYEVLGASCLSSIAGLDPGVGDVVECAIESENATWDEESERIEMAIEISASAGVTNLRLVFAATILAAA